MNTQFNFRKSAPSTGEIDDLLDSRADPTSRLEYSQSEPTHLCRECGHAGIPRRTAPGNEIVEVILWILGTVGAGFIDLRIFALPLAYTYLRSMQSYKGCAYCKSHRVIPIYSEFARKMRKV